VKLSAKTVDNAWHKLGYDVDDRGKHVKATLTVNGKLVAWTKRSHGAGKLEGNIGSLIRQQMRLNEDQFSDAIACPLTYEAYLVILREKGYLPAA
jgi:hypothetical protein